MKKAACFRGMFLHPPQWWRDFCTACKSLTWVASVGYTTNEHFQNRGCTEIEIYCSAHRRQGKTRLCRKTVLCFRVAPYSCHHRSFEQCRHACAKQWDHYQNPLAVPTNTGCPERIGHEGSMFSSGTSSPASPPTNKPRGVAVAATAILPANGPPQVWSDTRCKVGIV